MPLSTTARSTPGGIKLKDGYSTKIASAMDPDVSFWEKTVQPPGLDGGEMIPQTTMFNTTWRTFEPRALVTATDMQVVVAYDPAVLTQILALLNVPHSWTIHYPDGSTENWYLALRQFQRAPLVEGTQPEATITMSPTNQDPTSGVETGPAGTYAPGT